MCYFDGVPKVSDRRVPKAKPIQAWKGFSDGWGTDFHSPFRARTVWTVGKANKATTHGFYAVAKRPAVLSEAAGRGRRVKRVLLWGRVREYKNTWRHGYRAQFCLIPKRGQTRP